MPAVRYRLAPYGPEWSVTADVRWRARLGQVLFRSGRAPGTSPIGIGLAASGLAAGAWTFDVNLEDPTNENRGLASADSPYEAVDRLQDRLLARLEHERTGHR